MTSEFTFRECFSEFIGMLALCYFGGWAVIMFANEKTDLMAIAVVIPVIIATFTWASAAYSKCHFNPAITLGFFVTKQMSLIKSVFYITSQLVGSYIGSIMLYYTLPDVLYATAKDNGAELGTPHINSEFNFFSCFFAEFLGTFLVMFVFCNLHGEGKSTRFAVSTGLAYGLNIFMTGEITGAAANPFRYFGPALLSLQLWDSYIYMIAPFFGAIVAAFLYEKVFKNKENKGENSLILNDLSRMDVNN